jgi:hypothetical protein
MNQLDEEQLDELLGKFTDRALIVDEEVDMQGAADSTELETLQKTVLRLKAAAQTARANEHAKTRIRNRLLAEWKKTKAAERAPTKRFAWNWTLPRLALTGGFTVLILVGVVTLLTPKDAPLTAAAEGATGGSLFYILIGIIFIALALWNHHHD